MSDALRSSRAAVKFWCYVFNITALTSYGLCDISLQEPHACTYRPVGEQPKAENRDSLSQLCLISGFFVALNATCLKRVKLESHCSWTWRPYVSYFAWNGLLICRKVFEPNKVPPRNEMLSILGKGSVTFSLAIFSFLKYYVSFAQIWTERYFLSLHTSFCLWRL